MKTVTVIGGGASGIMAALTAAEDKNNSVLLLERQARIGRKLLSTGNGRCNLTNTGASAADYHGADAEFTAAALSRFGVSDALDFFAELGLLTVTEYGGRVYPLSNSANSVLDVMRFALDARGVDTRCSCTVTAIERNGPRFTLKTEGGDIQSDCVIVACGGRAGEKLGGTGLGYELLAPLGHRRTALHPALVQLTTDPTYPRALKGVRAQAALRLCSGDDTVAISKGELQFTETGLSGPAAFDISRAAALCGKGSVVHINFLDGYARSELSEMLKKRITQMGDHEASEILTGMLHNRLGKMLVKYSGIGGGRSIRELTPRDVSALVNACLDMCITLHGVGDFAAAQVTAGGIRCSEIDPATMESRLVPNLYVCGELLDVDGNCGGYNLQWAWTSGRIAGRLGK